VLIWARRRRGAAICGLVGLGFLLLALTELDFHPTPGRSDLYTASELVELSADCGAVGTLIFEGSHPELFSDARTPDHAWSESCMEQVQPHVALGFGALAVGLVLTTTALLLHLRAGRRSAP
ncbi:MAG: hypothetical protein ACTHKX_05060, partial [Pseudolysinimonas sp.]